MLKQNAYGYCLWRLYIYVEWKEEQKDYQTLCDDVSKDRYETSVRTPLRLSPLYNVWVDIETLLHRSCFICIMMVITCTP